MKGKIQVGNIVLNGEIEIEEKPLPLDPELKAAFNQIREDMYRWSAGFMIKPLYGSSDLGLTPKSRIVDGSLVRPIDDPTRLLEATVEGNK